MDDQFNKQKKLDKIILFAQKNKTITEHILRMCSKMANWLKIQYAENSSYTPKIMLFNSRYSLLIY